MKLTELTTKGLGQVFLFVGIGFALLSSLGIDAGISDRLFLPTLITGGILTVVGVYSIDKKIWYVITGKDPDIIYRKEPRKP